MIETGDGPQPEKATEAKAREADKAIEVTVEGATFIFSTQTPYAVTMQGKTPSD